MVTICSNGFSIIAQFLGGLTSYTGFPYMAIGSGTIAEGTNNTGLAAEITQYGGQRALATCSVAGLNTVWSHLFQFTGPVDFREVMLHTSAYGAGGFIFLRHLFPENTHFTDGMALEITITNTLSQVQ